MEPALFIVCAVIFVLHRLNNSLRYNVPRLLLHGIQTFLPSSFGKLTAEQGRAAATLVGGDKVDQRMEELNLGPMITLNSGLVSVRYITAQPLYKVYDTFVNVSICAVLSHLCLVAYRLLGGAAEDSSSKQYTLIDVSLLMLLMSLVMSLQGQLQVVYLTGLGAREARYTLIIGFFVFAISLYILTFQLHLVNFVTVVPVQRTLNSTAAHFQVVLSIWSDKVPVYSQESLKFAIVLCASAIFGGVVTGIVIPAMRYSHAFHLLMISGNRNERVRSLSLKAALVFDQMLLPLAIIAMFVLPRSLNGDNKRSNQLWVNIQVLSLLAAGLLRLALMKVYLQAFLNATIRTISLHVIDNNSTMAEIVRNKVEMRVNYLIPATLQYIAHPIFTLALSLLAYNGATNPAPENATELALSAIVGQPYAQDAVYRFLFHVGTGSSSPAVLFADLCHNIMTKLYIFPGSVFAHFALLLLCCYTAVWLLLHVVFIIYWSANSDRAQLAAGGMVTFRGQAFEGGQGGEVAGKAKQKGE